MFKLQPNPSFKAQVPLSVPGTAPVAVEFEFRHLSKSALKDWVTALGSNRVDIDALSDIILGWKGIDAPYGAESLALLLENFPAAAMDIFKAFMAEHGSAPAKN